ncbi:MAG: AAA family ATPase, partial [bacterium]
AARMEQVLYEVKRVVVGQDAFLERVLVAMLARGHLLVEGVPGLAKTLTVNTLARTLRGTFKRIQFTPDLLPADLVGTRVFNQKTSEFSTVLGPVFTNLLLADEINRAPAKVQSALLEVMQERQVTIAGETHRLPNPFLVMATQNPIETEGTYPLPEAQLDRFLVKLLINYPAADEELRILQLHLDGTEADLNPERVLETVTSPTEIIEMQKLCFTRVRVEQRILEYISAIVRKSRAWPSFELGASPRAGVAMLRLARAAAALEGRDFVLPDDVQEICTPVLRHRVRLTPEAEVEGLRADEILADLLRTVEVPK